MPHAHVVYPAPGIHPAIGQLWQFTSTFTSFICFRVRTESKKTCQARETPRLLTFDIWHFDTINGFSVSGRGSGGIDVFEKMLTGSSLLSSRRFSLVRYFTARDLFSLVRTDTLNNYSFIKPGALSPDYGSW